MNETLLSPETTADVMRALAVLLGGVSFGIGLRVLPRLKAVWAKEDLLIARLFLTVHLLVVLFATGTMVEHVGEPLAWRTTTVLVIFALKLVIFTMLRTRVEGMLLRADPPQRRAVDRA